MIDWSEEAPTIIMSSITHGVDPLFIATIRKVENGPPGLEFGEKSIKAGTYEEQLDITCNSVRNEIIRVHFDKSFILRENRICYSPTFIHSFQKRWCPLNATDDPNHLNKNWLQNATEIYYEFCKHGGIV